MRSEPNTEIGLIEMPGLVAGGRVELLREELPQSLDLVRALLELDARVEVLRVLADDHEVGLREAGAHALVGLARADARVEVELLAQGHVDRPVARAHRRGGRPLDGDAALADRVEGAVGERVPLLLVDVDPGVLEVPVELDAGGLEHAPSRLGKLGPGAVARDEGHAVWQVDPFVFTGARIMSRRCSGTGRPGGRARGRDVASRTSSSDSTRSRERDDRGHHE